MSSSAINQGVLSAKISNVQNVGDSSAVCSTTGDWSFKNATATATNVFISNAGNVGIGTTTPLNLKLDVAGNVHTSGSYILDNDNSLYWGFADGSTSIKGNSSTDTLTFSTLGTERMRIDVSGIKQFSNGIIRVLNTAISSGAGTHFIKWNSSTGDLTYDTSSRLIKDHITDSPYGLATVLELKPRKYFRLDDQKEEVGFIADEVQAVAPEFVPMVQKSVLTKNEEDTEMVPGGVNYDKLTAILTKAIQELSAKVEEQSLRLEAQAAEGAALRAEGAALRSEIEALKASAVPAPSEGANTSEV